MRCLCAKACKEFAKSAHRGFFSISARQSAQMLKEKPMRPYVTGVLSALLPYVAVARQPAAGLLYQ
jgi:hypothetical protein